MYLISFTELILRVVSFLGGCLLIVVLVPPYLGSFCKGHLPTSSQEKISCPLLCEVTGMDLLVLKEAVSISNTNGRRVLT